MHGEVFSGHIVTMMVSFTSFNDLTPPPLQNALLH